MEKNSELDAKYRRLCQVEVTIPIFSRAWWLDAVCEGSWHVCLVEQDDRIVASMPYQISRDRFQSVVLRQPDLTQTLGPWLRQSEAAYTKRLGKEQELLTSLIDQLPNFGDFHQNWHFTNTDWLPFHWRGFQQSTRYTYRIPDLSNTDQMWKNFRDNIRWEIRKAKNRYKLKVRTDLSIDDFMAINEKTFHRQGLRVPYTESFVKRLDAACVANKARKIFIAEDEQGRHHAGVFIVWDEQNAYYLMGGGDPELRASGATSLCLWEAIQFASTVTRGFDFEGSMIKPVERFVRAFGAVQTPYFSVTKTPSKIIQVRRFLSLLLNR